MSGLATCRVCAGSGRLVLMNSWLKSDGYRRERCGICRGSGKSNYRSPDYEESQRRLREALNETRARATPEAQPTQADTQSQPTPEGREERSA